MITDDEYLERIVAGIQATTTSGAEVTWNEIIDERQFDVCVRFQLAGLRYLVLFEVKNRNSPIKAEALDAFVTKARDQKSNKAVFVSAAGYQKGALAVAKRHGVELFTVTFDENGAVMPKEMGGVTFRNPRAPADAQPELTISEPTLAGSIVGVTVTYANGPAVTLPDETSQLQYYLGKSMLQDGRSLLSVITAEQIFELELGQELHCSATFEPAQTLKVPDTYVLRPGLVKGLDWLVVGSSARFIRGNVKIDGAVFSAPVIYTNVLTNEIQRFTLDQLPLGLGPVKVGAFYFITNPLNYYYCDAIERDRIRWILVESFQVGELYRGTYWQEASWGGTYIPVKDKAILSRLRRRLADYQDLERRRLAGETVPTRTIASLFD